LKPGSDPKLNFDLKPAPAKKADGPFNFTVANAPKSTSNPVFPAVSLPKSPSGALPAPAKPPAKSSGSAPQLDLGASPAGGMKTAGAGAAAAIKGIPLVALIIGGVVAAVLAVGIITGIVMSMSGSGGTKKPGPEKVIPKNNETDTSWNVPSKRPTQCRPVLAAHSARRERSVVTSSDDKSSVAFRQHSASLRSDWRFPKSLPKSRPGHVKSLLLFYASSCY
jgi:hypothetical protein